MATTTIHTLAYKIVADSSKFKSEMARTNAEIRAGKAVTEQFMPVIKRHEMEIAGLNKLYKGGRIDLATYNTALKSHRRAMFESSIAGKALGISLGLVKGAILAGGAAAVAFGRDAAIQIDDMARLGKAARRLGIDFEQIQLLTRGGMMEDIGQQDMVGAIENMMQVVALATEGKKKAVDALDRVGLTAQQLKGLGASDLLATIAGGISKIGDANTRLLATEKLLGPVGKEFSDVLGKGAEGIREIVDEAAAAANIISNDSLQSVIEADKAMDKLKVTIVQVKRELAVELAESGFLDDLIRMLDAWRGRNGEEPGLGSIGDQQRSKLREKAQMQEVERLNAIELLKTKGVAGLSWSERRRVINLEKDLGVPGDRFFNSQKSLERLQQRGPVHGSRPGDVIANGPLAADKAADVAGVNARATAATDAETRRVTRIAKVKQSAFEDLFGFGVENVGQGYKDKVSAELAGGGESTLAGYEIASQRWDAQRNAMSFGRQAMGFGAWGNSTGPTAARPSAAMQQIYDLQNQQREWKEKQGDPLYKTSRGDAGNQKYTDEVNANLRRIERQLIKMLEAQYQQSNQPKLSH